MKNKIIIIIGVLVVIVILFFVIKNISFAPTTEVVGENSLPANGEKIQAEPQLPEQTLPLSNDPKDVAWALFQKYLSYNKIKNLEGVRSTVYKVASVCEDPKTTIDCQARMGLAYQYGSVLKKEDFKNVWSDERQIILSTDFRIQEDDSTIGRNRAIIFFIKDNSGNLKMLSFSPFKGAIVDKGTASEKELNDRIITYTEDNDQDGIADYDEECLAVKEGQTCVKTSPKLRDTDSDGLWDGVEALMK